MKKFEITVVILTMVIIGLMVAIFYEPNETKKLCIEDIEYEYKYDQNWEEQINNYEMKYKAENSLYSDSVFYEDIIFKMRAITVDDDDGGC